LNVKLSRRIGKKYDILERNILLLSLKQNLLRNYHHYQELKLPNPKFFSILMAEIEIYE
jgi:hypothetical protein